LGGVAAVDSYLGVALAGWPEVALHLHAEPGVRGGAEDLLEADRHVGRETAVAVEQLGQRLAGNAEPDTSGVKQAFRMISPG